MGRTHRELARALSRGYLVTGRPIRPRAPSTAVEHPTAEHYHQTVSEGVARVAERIGDCDQPLTGVFTDVFDVFFRHLSAILDADGLIDEDAFLPTFAGCVSQYQKPAPGLADRFKSSTTSSHPCSTAAVSTAPQLRNSVQLVDRHGPSDSLQLSGKPVNPPARHHI